MGLLATNPEQRIVGVPSFGEIFGSVKKFIKTVGRGIETAAYRADFEYNSLNPVAKALLTMAGLTLYGVTLQNLGNIQDLLHNAFSNFGADPEQGNFLSNNPQVQPTCGPGEHQVQPNEWPYNMCRLICKLPEEQLGACADQLMQNNGISDATKLQIGECITLPRAYCPDLSSTGINSYLATSTSTPMPPANYSTFTSTPIWSPESGVSTTTGKIGAGLIIPTIILGVIGGVGAFVVSQTRKHS